MNEYKFYLTIIVLFGSLLIIIFTGAFGYMTDILEGAGMGLKNIYTIYNSERIEISAGSSTDDKAEGTEPRQASDSDASSGFSTLTAMVTAYTSSVGETDDTPCISASGVNICELGDDEPIFAIVNNELKLAEIIACPKIYDFETVVSFLEVNNQGQIYERYFRCLDRMSLKHPDRFDIYMGQGEEAYNRAMEWGVKTLEVKIYK